MNPLLARVVGNQAVEESKTIPVRPQPSEKVQEDVPVPCAAVSRQTFRDRLKKRRRESSMSRVMGEAVNADEPIIPKDAEEFEGGGQPYEQGLKPVKDVVMEPNDPYAGKEKMMTPSAALVAPDVTPDADKPIDPSAVPGVGSGARFRAGDADREPQAPSSGQALPHRAMDVLLARPTPPSQEAQPDAVVTAESAYRMMGVQSPDEQFRDASASGQALLNENAPMPTHVHSDGRQVLSVFRRFAG